MHLKIDFVLFVLSGTKSVQNMYFRMENTFHLFTFICRQSTYLLFIPIAYSKDGK